MIIVSIGQIHPVFCSVLQETEFPTYKNGAPYCKATEVKYMTRAAVVRCQWMPRKEAKVPEGQAGAIYGLFSEMRVCDAQRCGSDQGSQAAEIQRKENVKMLQTVNGNQRIETTSFKAGKRRGGKR